MSCTAATIAERRPLDTWLDLPPEPTEAFDAVEHPDPATRATQRADLDFWVVRARAALDRGVLV